MTTSDFTVAIESLCKIANSYLFDAQLDNAQRTMQAALQLVETNDVSDADHLKLLLQYGKILIVDRQRGHDPAFSILEEARQLAESTHDQHGLADALSLLASAHRFAAILSGDSLDSLQGKFNEALTYQQQAMELYEALHDTRGISESHFGFGNVYQFTQQIGLAHEHFTMARQIAEANGHLYERTEPTRHLALLALDKGNLDEALDYAKEALAFRKEVNFKPHMPLDHILLSGVYLARGDVANAQYHAEQALRLAEEIGATSRIVFALLSLGDIQLVRHDDEAKATYQRALTLAEQLGQPLLLGMVNQRLKHLT